MKILPEGFYTPGWNVDWLGPDGRRYYTATNLQGEERNGNQAGAERGFSQYEKYYIA
jgi:hypothetical protein